MSDVVSGVASRAKSVPTRSSRLGLQKTMLEPLQCPMEVRYSPARRSRPTTTHLSSSLDSIKRLQPMNNKSNSSTRRRHLSNSSVFSRNLKSLSDSAKAPEDRDSATVKSNWIEPVAVSKRRSICLREDDDRWKRDKTENRILKKQCFAHVDSSVLPEVPRPHLSSSLKSSIPFSIRCFKIQQFINQLEYNYVDQYFFNTKKNRPLYSILNTAKEITKECLPIRCIEGCFLGIFFTQNMLDVDRYPVMFASKMLGKTYKHIVLIVHHQGLFGALGMSRKTELAYKPLVFQSMSAVLLDYKQWYANYYHTLKKIRIGLPINHDSQDRAVPNWYFLTLTNVAKEDWTSLSSKIDEYVLESKRAANDYVKLQKLSSKYRRKDAQITEATGSE